MNKGAIFFLCFVFITTLNLNAQIVKEDFQLIEYGDIKIEVAKKWNSSPLPMAGDNNFGLIAINENPTFSFIIISLEDATRMEKIIQYFKDGSQSFNNQNLKILGEPRKDTFLGEPSQVYTCKDYNPVVNENYSGKVIFFDKGMRTYAVIYCGDSVFIDNPEFSYSLSSFNIDNDWKVEDDYVGVPRDSITGEYREFKQTDDGYRIYDTYSTSFEFPSEWTIYEDAYSARNNVYHLTCGIGDSLVVYFSESQKAFMTDEDIDNLAQTNHRSEIITYFPKKPVEGVFYNMKTKEYEFETSSPPLLKGKLLYFNDDAHYYYIMYGDTGVSYNDNPDFKRLFNTFKTDNNKASQKKN